MNDWPLPIPSPDCWCHRFKERLFGVHFGLTERCPFCQESVRAVCMACHLAVCNVVNRPDFIPLERMRERRAPYSPYVENWLRQRVELEDSPGAFLSLSTWPPRLRRRFNSTQASPIMVPEPEIISTPERFSRRHRTTIRYLSNEWDVVFQRRSSPVSSRSSISSFRSVSLSEKGGERSGEEVAVVEVEEEGGDNDRGREEKEDDNDRGREEKEDDNDRGREEDDNADDEDDGEEVRVEDEEKEGEKGEREDSEVERGRSIARLTSTRQRRRGGGRS